MKGIEIENRENDQVKKKFGPGGLILREIKTSSGLNLV